MADDALPMVALEGSGASKVADLTSIAFDLGFARDCFKRLSDDDVAGDDLLGHALWAAGVIAYRRAFTSGRSLLRQGARLRFDTMVDGLDAAHGGVHARLLHDANKYVAHRVN